MRIGVIVAGQVRESLAAEHGSILPMMERLLNGGEARFTLEPHAVVDGAPLPAPDGADGWLVTGSKHGVYDDLPWIAPTKAFLRAARAARRPMVGVCFGHQLMAEAFGGKAEKFSGGWRLGVQTYDAAPTPWRPGGGATLRLHANHQDQVVAIPEDAAVWAGNAGCRFAALSYGDPAAPDAVSIQPHPEFEAPYARALVDLLTGEGVVARPAGEAAAATIGGPVDNAAVGRMLGDYLLATATRRAAA